jgi:vacuolar-type H+-ATPase subunit E/Vma4
VTDPTETQQAALAPLRQALLDAARSDAQRVRDEAERDAAGVVGEAARRAAEMGEEARRRGVADGEERLARSRAAARREARAVVLRAQRCAYDGLRAAAAEAVADLLRPEGERARLRAVLVDALGGGEASVEESPDGGLRATAPDGRSVDASAQRLVDVALADLDVEGLWAP